MTFRSIRNPAEARAETARQGQARANQRTEFGQVAKVVHESRRRGSGESMVGRTAIGEPKETQLPWVYRVFIDGWFVSLGFRVEDEKAIDARFAQVKTDVKTFEGELRTQCVDRKWLVFDTHILSAVRTLTHVFEGYEKEVKAAEALVNTLTEWNLFAADKPAMTNDGLDDLIKLLKGFDKEHLSKKRVVVKRLLARKRLADSISRFEKAKGMEPGRDREYEISRGLAVLVSVRNRLATWRDKDVKNIAELAHERECALRVERDRWLFAKVSFWAEKTEEMYRFLTTDQKRLDILGRVEAYLLERDPELLPRILEGMQANAKFFDAGDKHDRMMNRYRELYATIRAISRKKEAQEEATTDEEAIRLGKEATALKAKALHQLNFLCLFVNSNQPTFVAEELGKTQDYVQQEIGGKSICSLIQAGATQFEAHNLEDAKALFEQARELMIQMKIDK